MSTCTPGCFPTVPSGVSFSRTAEFSLTALAYNFIRAVNIVGVATLLKAV
jgi:hypothetical protein